MGQRILIIHAGATELNVELLSKGKTGSLTWEASHRSILRPMSVDTVELWAEEVAAVVRKLPRAWRLAAEVVVIPAGVDWLVRGITVPVVDAAYQAQTLHYEVGKIVPYPIEEAYWDVHVLRKDNVEHDVLVVTGRKEIPEALCLALANAGLTPSVVMAPPVLDYNCYRLVMGQVREDALLLNIGPSGSRLTLISGQMLTIRSMLQAAGSDTSGESPTCLKFVAEIQRSLDAYTRVNPNYAPRKIYFLGGASAVTGLVEALRERLSLESIPLNVLQKISYGSGLEHELLPNELPLHEASWLSDSVGAATAMAGTNGAIKLNLLPPPIVRRLAYQKKSPFLLTAAACVTLASGLLGYGQYIQHKQLVDDHNFKQSQLALLDTNADSIHRELQAIAITTEQIKAVETLLHSRNAWSAFLYDLQNRLVAVGDVWLDRCDVLSPSPEHPVNTTSTLRLRVAGRMVDRANPLARVSANLQRRVDTLLESMRQSDFVAALEDKRFDTAENGILRFAYVLVIKQEANL
ncbi:MAG: hypothetical protein SFY80_01215 [Verrucomicrobiota bacterium]|nr:hypothetical protein [Verrucomicrobiota bacterium]